MLDAHPAPGASARPHIPPVSVPASAPAPSAPDGPAALLDAARTLLPVLEAGRALHAGTLRDAMTRAFRASDADGAWVWKDAYEAAEAAVVLFLQRYGRAMRQRAGAAADGPRKMLAMLAAIDALESLPSTVSNPLHVRMFREHANIADVPHSAPEPATMQQTRYRAWLDKRPKRGGGPYKQATVDQYIRDAKSVEKVYGNLDELYAKDRLVEVLQELGLAAKTRKQDGPDPKGLYGPGYRSAVTRYREYRDWAAEQADTGRNKIVSLVLFNIGWMNHYRGRNPSDRIFNGGRYVAEHETGHEIRNFEPVGGRCYGYVRAPRGKLNMKRLGAGAGAQYTDNVTVVFTATPPEGGGFIVGWYRNARVWQELRSRDDHDLGFAAEAAQEDCRLLEPHNRVFRVPRTGPKGAFVMGRSNVRYTDTPEAEPFVRTLREYIEDPDNWPRRTPGSAPRQSDPALRAEVEQAAVLHVTTHWPYPGYDSQSVERENKGWDLEFTRGGRTLLVEVKGCSGAIGIVELTPNEYAAMRKHRYRYKLAIVTHALEDPRLSIISFNGSDQTWRDQHEREVRLEPRTGARVYGHHQ